MSRNGNENGSQNGLSFIVHASSSTLPTSSFLYVSYSVDTITVWWWCCFSYYSFFFCLLSLLLLLLRYLLFITACQTFDAGTATHSTPIQYTIQHRQHTQSGSHSYTYTHFDCRTLWCIISPAFFSFSLFLLSFYMVWVPFFSSSHRCVCFFVRFVFFVLLYYYGPRYTRAMSETIPYVFIFVFYE